jgi:hypothetical protein
VNVTLWMCPTEGCGNYFASSHAGDLTEAWNLDQYGRRTFKRSRCPDCHVRGVDVDRVPVQLRPKVPVVT